MTLLHEILKEATKDVDPRVAVKYWQKQGQPQDILEIVRVFVDVGIDLEDIPDLVASIVDEIVKLPEVIELSRKTDSGDQNSTNDAALTFDQFSSQAVRYLEQLSKEELAALEKEIIRRYP